MKLTPPETESPLCLVMIGGLVMFTFLASRAPHVGAAIRCAASAHVGDGRRGRFGARCGACEARGEACVAARVARDGDAVRRDLMKMMMMFGGVRSGAAVFACARARGWATVARGGGPRDAFDRMLARGDVRAGDDAQARALGALQRVFDDVVVAAPGTAGMASIVGCYMHGGVGRGKTMLMDALFRSFEGDARERVRRVHFHAFMLDVHARLFALGAASRDGCAAIGEELASTTRVLCLDEIEISDVADAMVFKRVMEVYLRRGGALVGTSNSAPDGLYRGGINRAAFAPFIRTLRETCEIVDLVSVDNVDYRRVAERRDGAPGAAAAAYSSPLYSQTIVFAAADASRGQGLARRRALLTRAWDAYAQETSHASKASTSLVIPLAGGRSIRAEARSGERAAWFSFATICGGNFGPIDYLALAQRFKVVCIEDVPSLPIFSAENEARRFVNCVDILYEHDCVLLASFASATSPDEIFQNTSNAKTRSTGDELTLRQRTALESNEDIFVSAVGGSSGRSTTMTSETTEWSATGRFGAALAHVQSENFTAKAAPRAISRIAHMSSASYLERALGSRSRRPAADASVSPSA